MTTNSHAHPWTLAGYLADIFSRPARTPRPKLLTGREAAARALFAEAVQHSRLDMAEYDTSPMLRGGWLAEADRRIAGGRGADIPDLIVLRHWGYTPAEWNALPAIVQVDKREGFFQAQGLGA
jgi:hypothetical protein